MLRPLVRHINLKLAAVLVVLLDERLVFGGDEVVVEEWSLVEPVGHVRHCGLHNFKRAVILDLLTVCGEQEVALDLAVVSKWRFKANVVQGSDFIAVGHILNVLDGPLCEPCYAVGSVLVSLVLFDPHLSVSFEREEEALGGLKANRVAEHHRLARFSVVELEDDQLLRLADLHIFDVEHRVVAVAHSDAVKNVCGDV